jgi:galactitol-specific phosphotransferase system IIB component
MLKYLPIIFLFTSCITTNKVKKYLYEHPVQAAKLCLEQFPQESKTDTIRIVKDSLIVEQKVDSIYTWLVEEHYLESEVKTKIRTVIKELKDTIVITETKWDDKYKVLFEAKDKEYMILEDRYDRKSKALFYTWLWIAIIGVGAFAYKKYL